MNVFIWNGTHPPTVLKHVVGVLAVLFCWVLPLHSQSITKCNGESVLFVARMGRVDVFSHSSLKMKDLYCFAYNLCNYRFVGLFYLSFIYIFSISIFTPLFIVHISNLISFDKKLCEKCFNKRTIMFSLKVVEIN